MATPIFYPVAGSAPRRLPAMPVPFGATPPTPPPMPKPAWQTTTTTPTTTAPMSPALAAAIAKAKETDDRINQIAANPDAFFGGPVSATGYIGSPHPPSLLGQAWNLARAVPAGIGGFAMEGARTVEGVPRFVIDLARTRVPQQVKDPSEYGVSGSGYASGAAATIHEYFPLWGSQGQSIERSLGDVVHPSRFVEASREGTLLNKIVEDAFNVSLAGGVAKSVLGRLPMTVELGAKEAGAVTGEGAAARAAGAAPMTLTEALDPAARTAFTERSLLQKMSEHLSPTETRTVELPGKGLTGMAYRAGHETLANYLNRAAEVTHTVTQYGERAANAPAGMWTGPPRALNYAIQKVGGPDVLALAGEQVQRGIASTLARAERTGGFLFSHTQYGRDLAKIKSNSERLMTDIERDVIVPARIAHNLKLNSAEARAGLFLVDQAMYPLVQLLSRYGDRIRQVDDGAIDRLVERMYVDPVTKRAVDKSMRPLPADVKVLVEYATGQLDDVTASKIDQVAAAMGERATTRRNALLRTVDVNTGRPMLNPEQVGTDMLSDVVARENRVEEIARDRLQREQGTQYKRTVKASLVATAYDAIAAELPEPPKVGDTVRAGVRAGLATALDRDVRSRLTTAQRDLAAAVDEYVTRSEDGPSPRLVEAENRVTRLTGRVEQLRGDLERVSRQESATSALSKVTGGIEPGAPRVLRRGDRMFEANAAGDVTELKPTDVVEGERVRGNVTRPKPDLSQAETMTAIRDQAKRMGQEEATGVFNELEAIVGGDRMTMPAKPFADQPPPAHYEVLYGPSTGQMTQVKRFDTREAAEAFMGRLRKSRSTVRYVDYSGGEWNWWYQLPVATRRAMAREGWVRGRVSQGGERALGHELAPDQFTEMMNAGRNTDMNVNDAMPMFVEMFDRYTEAKGGTSAEMLQRLATNMGLPYEQVYAAVRGKLADYKGVLVDPVVRDMDTLRSAYDSMTDEEKATLDNMVNSIVNDPGYQAEGGVAEGIGAAIEGMIPEVDMTSSGGVLATFGNMVDVQDVVQWMRTGEQSETMRAVLAKRTAEGNLQLGQLRGQMGGLADLVRQAEAEQRQARLSVAAAQREADRNLAAAGKAVDNANEVEKGRRKALEDTGAVVDETPAQAQARIAEAAGLPTRTRAWERPAREPLFVTGRHGGPYEVPGRQQIAETIRLSPGEIIRQRQGAAQQAYQHELGVLARIERSIAYRNQKIGDMRSELSRGVVDRLIEDVNGPAITRWRNIVRQGGEPLGRLRGKRGERYVDGLMGKLAHRYHFYDELVDALDQVDARKRSDIRLVDDDFTAGLAGELDDVHAATQTNAAVFEQVAAEHGVFFEKRPGNSMQLGVDSQALRDSVAADTLLEEMNRAVAQDTRPPRLNIGGSDAFRARLTRRRLGGPNTTFRLRELIRNGMRDLPDDLRSQFEGAWEHYQKRRSYLLNRNIDRYAEAMPARYRTLAFTARRQIRTLLEMGEEANSKRLGSGDIYVDLATVTMDTLGQFVDAGIDPVHLIGGVDAPHPFVPNIGGVTKKVMRADRQRRTGLRVLDPAAQARVEADQLGRWLYNKQVEQINKHFTEGGFGRRADEVLRDQITEWELAHPGEKMPTSEMGQAAKDAGWASTAADGTVAEQTMLIPESIRRQRDDYGITNTLAFRFLTGANNKWKSWVLPLSTKWLTGNLFGNALSAWVYAGVNPVRLLMTMNEIRRMSPGNTWREKLADLWDRQGLPDWAPDQLSSHGLGWRDYKVMYDPATGGPRTPIGKLIEKSYGLNEFTDNMTRSAVYLVKLRKGVPSEAAMKVALNALGDFTRLSRFERRIVKQIIPFYPWLRHQTQATLRLPIESPARAAFLLHLGDLYSDPEENGDMMSLIGSSLPLGGGKFLDIGSVSPFAEADPYRMPFSPTAIGQSFSPVLKFGLAATTGLDVSRWEQITRPAATNRRGAYGQEEATPPWVTMLRNPGQGLGELGYIATQQVAPTQVRALRDIALGPNARYGSGYEIGSGTGKNLPAERGPLLNQLLRAAGVPSYRYIDLAAARRRAREQEKRQRG